MEGHAYTYKLNLAQLLRLRVAIHTLPLFHFRTDKIAQQWKSTLRRDLRGSQWWRRKMSAVFLCYGRERVCTAIVKYSEWSLGALSSLVACFFLRWLLCCALHCFVSYLGFHLLLSCIY